MLEDDELEDEETREDRIAELEAALGRVNQELGELREVVGGRFANITSRFSDVWLDLSRINGRVPQMETEVRWLHETAEDAITLLAQQAIEPANPRDWRYPPYTARARVRRRLIEINPAVERTVQLSQPQKSTYG